MDYVRDYERFGFRRVGALGAGTFGVVDLVLPGTEASGLLKKLFQAEEGEYSPARAVAVKSIAKSSHVPTDQNASKPSPKTERDILRIIGAGDCPFIVHYYGAICSAKYVHFLLEAAPHGDLFAHLLAEGAPLSEDIFHHKVEVVTVDVDAATTARLRTRDAILCRFAAMLIAALQYLHRHDILYRALNPENVLVTAAGNLKLCDFGLSKHLPVGGGERASTLCGVPDYFPPEFIGLVSSVGGGAGHDHFVDWWMLVEARDMITSWTGGCWGCCCTRCYSRIRPGRSPRRVQEARRSRARAWTRRRARWRGRRRNFLSAGIVEL